MYISLVMQIGKRFLLDMLSNLTRFIKNSKLLYIYFIIYIIKQQVHLFAYYYFLLYVKISKNYYTEKFKNNSLEENKQQCYVSYYIYINISSMYSSL